MTQPALVNTKRSVISHHEVEGKLSVPIFPWRDGDKTGLFRYELHYNLDTYPDGNVIARANTLEELDNHIHSEEHVRKYYVIREVQPPPPPAEVPGDAPEIDVTDTAEEVPPGAVD